MGRMEALYDVTVELNRLLEQPMEVKDREKLIEQTEALISKRELILQDVKEPYTDEERVIGRKLIPLEKNIQQKVKLLFMNLKNEMRSVKKQKSSNQKYINPYKNASNFDGTFLDKKK